ncbi:MAG TPA: dephospho-CoA kinase [Solirubrobacteraceae bacterium]|nr:dephospho-CoA kinase [Solirubrobacteraceae bacterium]
MAGSVPFVGLTGGLGAGKSTALAALERLGAEVISSDQVVHDLYEEPAVRDAVVGRFGEQVAPGGTVDRAELARAAFASDDGRRWLEELIWPQVGQRIAAWRAAAEQRRPPPPATVVEVPLLFEAGHEGIYDATIAVIASEPLRARRAAARGHVAVDERAARQLTQDEKAARATYVVENDGTVTDLERGLSDVLAKLTA